MTRTELEGGWDELIDFYGDVFGWTGDRHDDALLFVLPGGRQFVYVYGDDAAATAARPMDHLGVEVDDEDALDALVARARRRQTSDPRVEITHKQVTPAGPVDVVSCYLRFLLPLRVEVQAFR